MIPWLEQQILGVCPGILLTVGAVEVSEKHQDMTFIQEVCLCDWIENNDNEQWDFVAGDHSTLLFIFIST